MSFEHYLKNIKNLATSFGLTDPIELDDVLGATFIYNRESPILVNINYNIEKNTVTVDTLIATNMPSSRLGIQTLMNQLIGDLLTQDRSIGKLVAVPEEMAVKYTKEIDLRRISENGLAEFIPVFVNEALKWKQKFKDVSSQENCSSFVSKPREVVSFQYP